MDEKLMAEAIKAVIEAGIVFLTRKGLAVLLKASVRTVDEMVANNELRVMRPGGVLVRFYLPHVVEDLEKAAAKRLERLKVTSGQWPVNSSGEKAGSTSPNPLPKAERVPTAGAQGTARPTDGRKS
jgi:excisionase family DNA binding protein